MAYPNQYPNHSGRNEKAAFGNRPRPEPRQPRVIVAEEVPENYVDCAEKVMEQEMKQKSKSITTSKLRNLMSLLVDAFNVENRRTEESITPQSQAALLQMRVRLAYEYGRGNDRFKDFLEHSKLQEYLKGTGNNRQKFINLFHYVEALVAYHKYYGGEEN